MRKGCLALLLAGAIVHAADALTFRAQEIASGLGIVYAVTIADVNGDSKPDIVAINEAHVLWFENPTWVKHIVAERVTAHDNVAVAPYDINGDGKLDFALGADWQATNTSSGGSLHWITQSGKVHDIATEPTIHRIRWIDVDGDRRPELVVVPLHGRGTTAPTWTNGVGSRILVFHVPVKPDQEAWPMEVADNSLHIVHNFIGVNGEIWVASTEGVYALKRGGEGKWSKHLVAEGQPGEIKLGHVNGARYLATVEPWHGNSVVAYQETKSPWSRTVIDTSLNQAHALGWGDFDSDGEDELVAGWRGKPWGLVLYKFNRGAWKKTVIDEEVAVEDLALADLNADGRPEIVAGGRATGNIRIYWPSK
jgi:hypothetical protein